MSDAVIVLESVLPTFLSRAARLICWCCSCKPDPLLCGHRHIEVESDCLLSSLWMLCPLFFHQIKIAMLIHASDARIDSLLLLSRTSYHKDSRLPLYDVSVYRSMWTSALWIGDSDVVGVSCAAAVFTEDAWVRLSIPLFLIVSQSFFCFCLHLLLIFLHRDAIGMPATHGSSVRALSCVKKQKKAVVWPPLR